MELTQSGLLAAGLLLVAALLCSSVGHAGASGYIAIMALLGVAPDVMRPTALALNVAVALIAIVKFYRAGTFSWQLFLPLTVAATGPSLQSITPPVPFWRRARRSRAWVA